VNQSLARWRGRFGTPPIRPGASRRRASPAPLAAARRRRSGRLTSAWGTRRRGARGLRNDRRALPVRRRPTGGQAADRGAGAVGPAGRRREPVARCLLARRSGPLSTPSRRRTGRRRRRGPGGWRGALEHDSVELRPRVLVAEVAKLQSAAERVERAVPVEDAPGLALAQRVGECRLVGQQRSVEARLADGPRRWAYDEVNVGRPTSRAPSAAARALWWGRCLGLYTSTPWIRSPYRRIWSSVRLTVRNSGGDQ